LAKQAPDCLGLFNWADKTQVPLIRDRHSLLARGVPQMIGTSFGPNPPIAPLYAL